MPTGDLPQLSSCTSAANYYSIVGDTLQNSGTFTWPNQAIQAPFMHVPQGQYTTITTTATQKEQMPESNRRVVQVFIADPNENIPLEKALLYQDKAPFITDATDQELFFDIDIKTILDDYNAFRVTVVDKDASEGKSKDVMLEPAKIRDLKMVVVTVASL